MEWNSNGYDYIDCLMWLDSTLVQNILKTYISLDNKELLVVIILFLQSYISFFSASKVTIDVESNPKPYKNSPQMDAIFKKELQKAHKTMQTDIKDRGLCFIFLKI